MPPPPFTLSHFHTYDLGINLKLLQSYEESTYGSEGEVREDMRKMRETGWKEKGKGTPVVRV